jgi:hypothetical protein
VARGIFGNIFENSRASCKYVGCGLILENMRGLSAKFREMGFSRNYFVEDKSVDQVHKSVDHTGPVHHGSMTIVAHGSSASGRSSSLALSDDNRGGGVGHGGLGPGLTGA